MKKVILLGVLILVVLTGCDVLGRSSDSSSNISKSLDEITVPDNFDYKTTKE